MVILPSARNCDATQVTLHIDHIELVHPFQVLPNGPAIAPRKRMSVPAVYPARQ